MEIKEAQQYIQEICKKHGWDKNTQSERFLLFVEEVGELAKAIRYEEGMYVEKGKEQDIAGEFADVFSYLLDLANKSGVDLEDALIKKQEANLSRVWVNRE
jgi:NTP pyrophosphatase (non-canonical NTP hydrolase)